MHACLHVGLAILTEPQRRRIDLVHNDRGASSVKQRLSEAALSFANDRAVGSVTHGKGGRGRPTPRAGSVRVVSWRDQAAKLGQPPSARGCKMQRLGQRLPIEACLNRTQRTEPCLGQASVTEAVLWPSRRQWLANHGGPHGPGRQARSGICRPSEEAPLSRAARRRRRQR